MSSVAGDSQPTRDGSSADRRWIWAALLPVVGAALGDGVLAGSFCTASQVDRDFVVVASLHLLAASAWMFALWGWVPVVLEARLARRGVVGGVAALSVTDRRGLLGLSAVAYAAFDHFYASTFFTGHYSAVLGRCFGAAVMVVALAGSGFMPTQAERQVARRAPWPALAIALWVCLMGVSFGTSWTQWTTKHFREFGYALVVYPWFAWYAIDALLHPRGGLRRALVIWLSASVVAIGSLGWVSGASQRATYTIVTRLWSTPAVRRVNRVAARHWLAPWTDRGRTLAGDPSPRAGRLRVETTPVRCTRRPDHRADSALILTVDSLRADYFGVPEQALPAFARLRRESQEFTRAMQAATGTGVSLFALHSGHYATSRAPVGELLHDAAVGVAGAYAFMRQPWDQPVEDFARDLLRAVEAQPSGSILHAHVLSLHPAKNWAGSGFDYAAMLVRIDRAVGTILEQLGAQGRLDRMLLVVSADHGEELGRDRGYQGHGFDVTQSLVHTPLFVRLPGVWPGQPRGLVSGVDVAPTVLDALGIECPVGVQGRSLLSPVPDDRTVFASAYAPGLRCLAECRVYADIHAAIQGDFELIFDRGENALGLFDLRHRPIETDNLIDERPDVAASLRAQLQDYLAGQLP